MYCGNCKYGILGCNEEPCTECLKVVEPIKWEPRKVD